jgi:copper chaperone CopZ
MGNLEEQVLKIKGMMCNGCETKVANAIKGVEGVKSVEVSHKEGTARVTFDSNQTDLLFITMAVNNTHYKVVEEI